MRRTRRGPASIRARLTAGTAIVAAVLLVLLAVLVVLQTRSVATSSATQLAADDLRPYAVDLQHQPDETPDLPAAGLLVLVEDPNGTIRRDSMPAGLSQPARTITGAADLAVGDDEFRVVARAVTTSRGTWHLWAARDLTASDSLLNGVVMTVTIGTPIAVLLMALTAWLVASAAIRPVERMRSTAERLRSAGSEGSLPTRGAGELADLAATLNGLIEDLRASAAHERRVTADAAHELRTPLAVLAAQIELAQRDPDAVDLDGIRASVDRMTHLADSLLALSRADAASDSVVRPTRVSALVTEAMEAVDRGRLLAPPEVLVDIELASGLDEDSEVDLDPMSFGRILANLIGNALAAGPAGLVTVRLRTDPAALVLEVQDDGPGLPGDFISFAFDRFARAETTRSSGSSGAGLGLALVKALSERAGGTVSLHNGAVSGALATVRLPTRAVHEVPRRRRG